MKTRISIIIALIALFLNSCRVSVEPADGGIRIGDQGTPIEGNLSGILRKEDSPFVVTDDIFVYQPDTLRIEAGVSLYFGQNKRLLIEGLLIANGDADNKIIFRSYQDSTWLGIAIKNSIKVSEFNFCIIQQVDQENLNQTTKSAAYLQNANAIFQNCVFQYNFSHYGGGLSADNSTLEIKNCIIRENISENFGGALLLESSTCIMINNTICFNTSYQFGGGVVISEPASTNIQNNIFYGNYSFSGDPRIAIISGDSTNVTVQYNFLDDGTVDPDFISASDLHLRSTSPCKDSGNPDTAFNDNDGTRNDQGAYGGPNGNW